VDEEQSYYTLQNQLTTIRQQILETQRAYQTATNSEHHAEKREQAFRHSLSKVAPTGVREYSALARQKQTQALAAQEQLKQLETMQTQLQQQFKAIPSANGHYVIDLFAMAQGTDKKGQLIYDVGAINPGAP